jgi:hypothetical protein
MGLVYHNFLFFTVILGATLLSFILYLWMISSEPLHSHSGLLASEERRGYYFFYSFPSLFDSGHSFALHILYFFLGRFFDF